MSSKASRKSSAQANTSATTSLGSQNQRVSGGYVPATLRAERRRTRGGNVAIGLGALLGVGLLSWLGLVMFAPHLLPSFLVPPTPPPSQYFAGERISFVRTSGDGKRDLYVVNADGTNQQQVTRDVIVDGSTTWSRDGRQIIMQAQLKGVSRVLRYTIGQDNKTTESVQLTADIEADSVLPAWSPDNKLIAFQTKRDGGDYQVFVMDSNGNGKRRLSDGKGYAGQPAWSPDGKNVIYVAGERSDPGVAKELFVVPASGGTPKQITSLGADLGRPAWSPDGKHLIYLQNRGDRNRTIFVANADGSSPRAIADMAASFQPMISPDSSKLVYYSVSPSTGSDVFTIPITGGNPTNLTTQSAEDYVPAWSLDGKRLAWASRPGDNSRIVVANADGSEVKQVSHGEGADHQPSWGAQVR